MKEFVAQTHLPSVTLEELFEEHSAFVVRTLARLGVRQGDIKDVTQDIFIKVGDRLDSYRPECSVRAWLFGFCQRSAANYRRLARHREKESEFHEFLSEAPDPLQATQDRQNRRTLALLLEELAPDLRDAVVASEIIGLTAPEIAGELKIPVNTVYSRVRRGRESLLEIAKSKGVMHGV